MADVYEILEQVRKISDEINHLLVESKYKDYRDLSGLNINHQDGDQLFILHELCTIMNNLSDAKERINYLFRPIEEIGNLYKNEVGRYETKTGDYYTCGKSIEALVMDEDHDVPYWVRTRIEHDGADYYLVGYKHISLEGLPVRIRKEK